MNIYKKSFKKGFGKEDKIVVEIPYWSKRINPYMLKENGEPEDVGKYPTLTGLIIHHKKDDDYDEIGFAQTIDMDYKDKGDQVDGFVVMWDGEEEDFRKKCEELGLGHQEIWI